MYSCVATTNVRHDHMASQVLVVSLFILSQIKKQKQKEQVRYIEVHVP